MLDQIKYLQIQDWALVDLNHLMKYHPVPHCLADTQQYQDPSSHSASFLQPDFSQSVSRAVLVCVWLFHTWQAGALA